MAKAQTLTVAIRETTGKRRNRRMRDAGQVPAVLYGHQKEAVSLTLKAEELDVTVRHGNRFVALAGAVNESALIKYCQWDTWGARILHVDLTRVGEHEKIQVVLPLELYGEAAGLKDGGVVKQVLHELKLECEAGSVPEKIDVNINHLEFNHSLIVADLKLPEGAKALADATQIVVSCTAQVEASEEEAGEAGAAEPEVIGRKKAEEEEA